MNLEHLVLKIFPFPFPFSLSLYFLSCPASLPTYHWLLSPPLPPLSASSLPFPPRGKNNLFSWKAVCPWLLALMFMYRPHFLPLEILQGVFPNKNRMLPKRCTQLSGYSNLLFSFFTQWVDVKTEWEVALENFIRNLYNLSVRVLRRNTPHIYKDLAHIITEGGKFQDVQGDVPWWEPRRADEVSPRVSVKTWERGELMTSARWRASRLETQEELVFQVKSEGGKTLMSQLQGCQEELSYLGRVSLFGLFSPLANWWGPPTFGRAFCFTQSTVLNVDPIQKHSHRNTQNNQISGHSVAQAGWHMTLTITITYSV